MSTRPRQLAFSLLCAGLVACAGRDRDAADASMHEAASDASHTGHDHDAASSHDANVATGTTDAGHDGAVNADASTPTLEPSDKLCSGLGWCKVADTKLASVCPDSTQHADIQGYEGCAAVINDWSGGIADTQRQRLLLWGGGHHGYFGNELYALDLVAGSMLRLDEPSAITGVDLNECTPPEAYADGRPSSRHTYDGLAYIAERDQLYAIAGSGIPCGYGLGSTWTLDLSDLKWAQRNPTTRPTKAAFGVVSDYDAASKRVILNDGYNLWAYDSGSNSYTLLNDSDATSAHIDYHMTGRVDPEHGLFVIFGGRGSDGGGLQVFDIGAGSSYAQQDWTDDVTGCDALLDAASPGLAYDTKQKKLIGWAGGDDVYAFDADAKVCTKITHANGPGPQQQNGTFGRFRYFAAFGVFAVVNAADEDAFTLRLSP